MLRYAYHVAYHFQVKPTGGAGFGHITVHREYKVLTPEDRAQLQAIAAEGVSKDLGVPVSDISVVVLSWQQFEGR